MGGYFANRSCPHHQSIARVYPEATIDAAAPDHPVSRGWNSFTLHDEPYINNYFGGPGNRLAPNVTALATSMLPSSSPKREIVAWAVERTDGGRGFGIVMPHFYKNWGNDDLRGFILNGIVWTAKVEVPPEGVETERPDLDAFDPGLRRVHSPQQVGAGLPRGTAHKRSCRSPAGPSSMRSRVGGIRQCRERLV